MKITETTVTATDNTIDLDALSNITGGTALPIPPLPRPFPNPLPLPRPPFPLPSPLPFPLPNPFPKLGGGNK